MAEKLCYLNDWDHFAVPISALEAALKHGQLDTVAFYLKTKGKGTTAFPVAYSSRNIGRIRLPPYDHLKFLA
jgi:spatacsin